MAKLRKAVYVKDPDRSRTVLLLPGEEPEQRLAALVTNPDAWEDGTLPAATEDSSQESDNTGKDSGDSGDQPKAAPAAKKAAARKSAASRRSGGREAADEGSSGD